MLSQADQAALNSYETQIAAMEDQASSQGNTGSDFKQNLDNWLAEIKEQLGASDGDNAPAMPPSGTNGSDSTSGQANGSSADGSIGTDGTNAGGTGTANTGGTDIDGSGNSTPPSDTDLVQLESILAQHGATSDEQQTAVLGALNATQTYGQGQMNALLYAAKQYGYSGVNTVLSAEQISQNLGLDANEAAALAFEALGAQQSGGADAASAYLLAVENAGGMGGAENVLQAIWTSQASGASSDTVANTAWDTSLKDQQQAFGDSLNGTAQSGLSTTNADTPSIDAPTSDKGSTPNIPPQAQSADEIDALQKLTDDIRNNADGTTIAKDSLTVSQTAGNAGDLSIAELALAIGRDAQAGQLGSTTGQHDLAALKSLTAGSDDAQSPVILQSQPPQAAAQPS